MAEFWDSDSNPVVSKCEVLLRDWLTEEGADRVDVDYQAIHRVARVRVWLMRGEERKSVHLPREVSFAMHDIRGSQVDPHRGAWLYSHFWMEAAEGVLHQECDWMREPVIDDDEPVMDGDAALELDQFPRDPEWIPEWMAAKIAEYHEEEARESQKADTEAAQPEGNGTDEPSSGRGGRSAIE